MRLPPATANRDDDSAEQTGLKTGWVGVDRARQSTRGAIYVRPGFDWTASDVYLFDVDGTLLNSRDAVHYHGFHRAVRDVFDLDLRLDGVPIHGNTDIGILRAYLESAHVPESVWRSRLPEVVEVMSADVERNAAQLQPELCLAVPELVRWLSSRGKLLGVASGNVERVAWAKLRACGLRDYFLLGAFSGTLEKREDIIAHGVEQARQIRSKIATVTVIGDTPADIRAAHANGVTVIAVATGIYSTDELLAHDPDMCVSCCEDLMPQETGEPNASHGG